MELMVEEKPVELPISEQEVQIEAPSLLEKIQAQKKKILIGLGSLLGVLILAGAVFGVYKYAQNQIPLEPGEGPTPTLIATPTPDPTADWKTYTNTKYGYSIKYPPGTEIVEGPGGEGKILGTDFLFSGPNEESWVYDGFNISISIVKNPNNKKPKEFTQEVYNSSIKQIQTPGFPAEGDIADCKVEEITRGEVDGSRFTYCIFAPGGGILAFSDWFIHNGNTIEIHARLANEPHREIFNLMLSTFKFLPSASPSTTSSGPSGSGQGKKVYCENPRSEVCTMECIQNPPYICGSDGESYCTECQACANSKVEWYVIQDQQCE